MKVWENVPCTCVPLPLSELPLSALAVDAQEPPLAGRSRARAYSGWVTSSLPDIVIVTELPVIGCEGDALIESFAERLRIEIACAALAVADDDDEGASQLQNR